MTALLRWWRARDYWTQIMLGACLLCALELAVIWAVRPYLLEAVSA